MKLLICKICSDVFNLTKEPKRCSCGETKGRYIDVSNIEFSGSCEFMIFDKESLKEALKTERTTCKKLEKTEKDGYKTTKLNSFIIQHIDDI